MNPIKVKRNPPQRVIHPIPSHNGFGSEEDSLLSVFYLNPAGKVHEYYTDKFKRDKHILRFSAKLISPVPSDEERKFIVSYYVKDESIQIYEIADRNSGRLSCKFLERKKMKNPYTNRYYSEKDFEIKKRDTKLSRTFPCTPFVPSDKSDLENRCEEILTIQATGLATRLAHTGIQNVVLGLSGGLDSTLALIVCVHAFDMLSLDRKNIHTVTMPCFGTTKRTKSNAEKLAEAYGVSFEEINITLAVRQHFSDIGHDESVTNITYENSQARERTQILMDLSNKYNGLVIGTGDLSELALGWATYNGDHMSMYAVNASIPKTLVRYLTAYEAQKSDGTLKNVLLDVLDTPVSPELLPPDKNGEIVQKTEDVVGPYELHDFFLYYLVRFGYAPSKIYYMAKLSFKDKYSEETIKKWLTVFIKRFFSQQFKRSCLPDGPKVGSVTLSPRSDWRMPSDASVKAWLDELENA